MKRTGKPLYLLGALVLVLSVVVMGCGAAATATPAPAATTAPAATQAPAATAAPAASPAAAGGAQVVLHGITLDDPALSGVVKALIPQFEASHPNIKVDLQTMGFDVLYPKLKLDITSGANDWDFIYWLNYWTGTFFKANAVLPLDDYMKRDGVSADQWLPKPLSVFQNDGKTYALPGFMSAITFYYRKDLFDDPQNKAAFKAQFGYDLEPPQTWKEFIDTGKFFYHPEKNFYGDYLFGKTYVDLVFMWMMYLKSAGVDYFDANWMPHFDDPASVSFFNMYKESFKYAPPNAIASEHFDTEGQFLAGKSATLIAWSQVGIKVGNPQYSTLKPDQLGASSMPILEGTNGVHNVYAGDWAYSIGAKSQHPEEAWQFIKFLTQNEVAGWKLKTGDIPTQKATYDSPELKADPYMSQLPSTMTNAIWMPPFGDLTDEWTNKMMVVVGATITGQKTPEEGAKEGQAISLDIVKRAGLYKGQ